MGREDTAGMEIDLSLKLDAQENQSREDDDDQEQARSQDEHHQGGEFSAQDKNESKVDEDDTSADNSLSETIMRAEEVRDLYIDICHMNP